jgi:hypothetical protein
VVKVVAPTELLRRAAEVLGPIREEVVLIGALAVQIALDGYHVPLTPTHDADVGSSTERANEVVAHLEERGLRRSELPHEKPFTWVGPGIKVQVVRPFHPFAKGAAARLPVNQLVAELETNRWLVAFEGQPEKGVMWAARPAALVALKEKAFGRTRPGGEKVDRDFSDAVLLFDRLGEKIVDELADDGQMRNRVIRAAERLQNEEEAAAAAARELVAIGEAETLREGEAAARRVAREMLRELGVL